MENFNILLKSYYSESINSREKYESGRLSWRIFILVEVSPSRFSSNEDILPLGPIYKGKVTMKVDFYRGGFTIFRGFFQTIGLTKEVGKGAFIQHIYIESRE